MKVETARVNLAQSNNGREKKERKTRKMKRDTGVRTRKRG